MSKNTAFGRPETPSATDWMNDFCCHHTGIHTRQSAFSTANMLHCMPFTTCVSFGYRAIISACQVSVSGLWAIAKLHISATPKECMSIVKSSWVWAIGYKLSSTGSVWTNHFKLTYPRSDTSWFKWSITAVFSSSKSTPHSVPRSRIGSPADTALLYDSNQLSACNFNRYRSS